jgi:hypothetical protein
LSNRKHRKIILNKGLRKDLRKTELMTVTSFRVALGTLQVIDYQQVAMPVSGFFSPFSRLRPPFRLAS